MLGEYSGYYAPGNLPGPVVSESGKMFITFSTNNTVTKPGWKGFYESQTVGIESRKTTGQLLIVPNPADQFIYIILPNCIRGVITVDIFNLQGEIVHEFTWIIDSADKVKLNVSKLNNGLFLTRIKSQNTLFSGKFSICR